MSLVLIHSARQLLTLRGSTGPRRGAEMEQLRIISDGALLIQDGVIVEVGPTRRVENLFAARKAREISAAGRVVMPGFVDSHTHLISGPSRLPDEGGTLPRVEPHDLRMILPNIPLVREATSRKLTTDAITVLKRCLMHGTTTLEAKSGYGLTFNSEMKILRVLTTLGDAPITVVPTLAAASVIPPEFADRPAEYIDWVSRELLPEVHKRGLVRFVDGACDRGAFSAAQLRPLFKAATELRLPVKMSLALFEARDAAALLPTHQFASLDHLDHITGATVAAIAESGTIATLTPAASFFLGAGVYAPARALISRGTPVALASNYNRVTSPTYNMQLVIFLACHKLQMKASEAISAATINSAHALKLGHRIGSLEAGKQADIVILNVGDYRELAYEFGINLVDMTIKQGEVVFDRSGVKWPAS